MNQCFHSLLACALAMGTAHGAISVGPAGSGLITFDTAPAVSNGWSTMLNAGASGDIQTMAQLAAQVQTNVAQAITSTIPSTATVPNITSASVPRWNSANSNLQTVATTAGYLTLLATLHNDTGTDQNALTISFDRNEQHAPGTTLVEEIPGWRLFFSLTGQSGTWTEVPALSGEAPGPMTAALNLGGVWPNGGTLYVLWADDNGSANRDNLNVEEGGYTLDNVSFAAGIQVSNSVTVTSPMDGAAFPQGIPITISANATMMNPIQSVTFFDNGSPIGEDTSPPYSVILSNASLGTHALTARALDDTGLTVDSRDSVTVTVVSNASPTIAFLRPRNGQTFPVGDNITNEVVVSDSDGLVTRVEFFVDGALAHIDNAAPFRFEMGDALAGLHTLRAVAVDNGGKRGSNGLTLFVVNPPNVTWFVPNGSVWRFLDDGSDQGNAWIDPLFNDTDWPNGLAELGYGDLAQDRPERTLVQFGPNPNAKFATTYFRKGFNADTFPPLANLVLRVLRDDRVRVYLNGTTVFNDITNTPLTSSSYTLPTAPDDGTIYLTTNLPAALLNHGANTLAAEVHQDSGTSSDISFDLMLGGETFPKPYIRIALDAPDNVQLEWWPADWKLQFAQELPPAGPPMWSDVPGGTPYSWPVTSERRFFRAVSPDGMACTPEVVGFVNLALFPGTTLIANPFDGTNNHLNTVLPLAMDGTEDGVSIFRWNPVLQMYGSPIQWSSSNGWVSADALENYVLNPGQGVAFQNTLAKAFDVTMVGTVRQGAVTNRIPGNFSLLASQIPIAAPIDQLGFPPIDGVLVQLLNPITQMFENYIYDGIWDPSVPFLQPGRSMFVNNPGAPVNWTRSFSVACGSALQIVQQPQSQSVLLGGNATFSVVATSQDPLSYRWFFAGNLIPGATGPAFTRVNAQYTHAGDYFVVVSNSVTAVTSDVVTLQVFGPVVINEWMPVNTGAVLDPADNDPDDWFELYNAGPSLINLSGFRLSNLPGNSNLFVIPAGTAIPPGGFLLFWADGEIGQGINHVNFTLNNTAGSIALYNPNSQLMDSITYSNPVPNISQGRGPDASTQILSFNQPTPQTNNPTFPIIIQHPTNQIVDCYGTVTFTAQAIGALPLSYQWQRNGCDPIPGANSPTLTISNATLTDVGSYSVTVSNLFGRVTSEDASLRVQPAAVTPRLYLEKGTNLVITWPKTCLDFILEQALDLNSPAIWSHPGEIVGPAGTNLMVTLPLSSAQGYFRLSTPSTRILASPRGGNFGLQEFVTLSVVATGAPPITYQWRLNGRDLIDQTNSVLAFDLKSRAEFGLYEVVVEGPDMAIVSEPAVLRPRGPQARTADNFADRNRLPNDDGSLLGNSSGATLEPNEPVHAGVPGGQTVWFSWRPVASGIATIDTIGSAFDTVLAVYAGADLASLVTLVNDDDSAEFLRSRVQFNAVSNVEYQIAIDGVGGAGGFFMLNWFLEPTSETVPIIVVQPNDIVSRANQSVTFTVVATNPGPLNLLYQWFRDQIPIAGQSGPELTLPNVRIQDVAEYRVVITAGQRQVASRSVSLQFLAGPENLRFDGKLNLDFICGTDLGNIPSPDRKAKVMPLKIAPSSSGSLSSSLTTYSASGSPPYICKSRSYKQWLAVTTDCTGSSTLTFDLLGTSGKTTLAGYYITTDRYLDCGFSDGTTPQPTISFTAIAGRTYRVIVGRANSGTVITLNYSSGPCL